MAAEAKSVFRKQKRFFRNYYSFEIPDSKEFDATVCQKIRQTERLTIFYQIVRDGLNQSDSVKVNTLGFRRWNWMDWLITISSLINVIRFGVLSQNIGYSVSIFFGDPLFRIEGGQVLSLWISVSTMILYLFREWILTLEARGKFKALSVWNVCCNGFDPKDLKMNKLNTKRFRFTVYLVSLTFYWIMQVIPLVCLLLYFSLMLTNSWMYKIPGLAFSALLWSFSFCFPFTMIYNALIGFAWYIMCALHFHLYQLRALIHRGNTLVGNSKRWLFAEQDIQSLCTLTIHHLNDFEVASQTLRYILLCYFFVIAAAVDFDIFLGTVMRVGNDLFSNLIATSGVTVLLSAAIFGLVFGSFITQLGELTIRLHQLSCKNKLSMPAVCKVLELMDRAAGPYNGLKIGDFLTLEKRFFIFFMAENISLLLLFTVNIGPLIK